MSKTTHLLEMASNLLSRTLSSVEVIGLLSYVYDNNIESISQDTVSKCLLNTVPNYETVVREYNVGNRIITHIQSNYVDSSNEQENVVVQSLISKDDFRLDVISFEFIKQDSNNNILYIMCTFLDKTKHIIKLQVDNEEIITINTDLESDTKIEITTPDCIILFSHTASTLYKLHLLEDEYYLHYFQLYIPITENSTLFFYPDWFLINDTVIYCMDYEGNIIRQINKPDASCFQYRCNVGSICYPVVSLNRNIVYTKLFNKKFETPYFEMINSSNPVILDKRYIVLTQWVHDSVKVIVYKYTSTEVLHWKTYNFREYADIDISLENNNLFITLYDAYEQFNMTYKLNE